MAEKSEKEGVVVSNKMQKTCVVAVEWQVPVDVTEHRLNRGGIRLPRAVARIVRASDRRRPLP